MALSIHSSTPAVATNASPTTQTITTASFTPPAGALLVILWSANAGSAADPSAPTITDNLGSHLTYTRRQWDHQGSGSPSVFGQAAIWTAPVGSSAAMTVTVTNNASSFYDSALAVMVLADSGTPTVGASGAGRQNSGTSVSATYSATATGSWGFLVVADWDAVGSETAGTGMTSIGTGTLNSTDLSYGIFRRSTADGTNGSNTTVACTLPSASTNLHYAYIEIKPYPPVTGDATQAITASTTADGRVNPARGDATQAITAATTAAGSLGAHGNTTQAITASTTSAGSLGARGNASQAITATTVATGTVIKPPFPQSPLAITVELLLGGTWTDVTARTRGKSGETPITITRGRTGEGAATERSTCTLTFDNRSGDFSPRNPSGQWYGLLGRNTPIRVTITEGGPYLLLQSAGDSASCPDSAPLSISGDLDLRVDLYGTNWTAAGDLLGKYDGVTPDRGYMLILDAGGILSLWWAATPSAGINAVATTALPMDGAGRLAVRATLDVDNGASGWTATFYTASTMAGPWRQLGDPVTGSGVTSIRDNTRPLQVGDIGSAGYSAPVAGRYYSAQVRAGIDGTIVASPDFRAQSTDATAFFDGQGNHWTFTGAAALAADHERFHGEVPEWPQKWDKTGNDAWTTVQAAGILRRLGQGASPLSSTLRRAITSLTPAPVAYWPAEEGQYASIIGSAIDGGNAMTVTTTTGQTAGRMAASTDFAASAPLPTVEESAWAGAVGTYTSTGQTQLRFLIRTPTTGTLALDLAVVARLNTTGTITRWDVQYGTTSSGSLRVVGYDSGGTAVLTTGWLGAAINGRCMRVGLCLTQSGADISWVLVTVEAGAGSGVFISDTLTSRTVGTVTTVEVNPSKQLGSTVIGHVSVEPAVTSIFDVALQLNAYLGEAAGRRFQRLCAESGIPFVAVGDLDDTVPMGYQLPRTLLDLLRQCADSDGGILYEPRDQLGLGYRTRASLERQNPTVSLSYPGHQLVELSPVEDDLITRNDVTVTREGGASARAVLQSGPLSVQAVPDGIGKYDTSLTLSLGSDDAALRQAQWHLHLGTVDEARYPTLAVNLANRAMWANPGLVHDVLATDIGDRLVVTGPPKWVPPEDISQLIQGSVEKLGQYQHGITWNLAPESPYRVAIYGDPLSRYLPDGSTLAAGVDSTSTTLSVATPTGPLWSHADGDFNISVAGEQMTVSEISGTSSPQTFTVTRSVNGVVKSHLTGEDVTLAEPVFYSL